MTNLFEKMGGPTHWELTECIIRMLSVQMKNRIMGNME